MLPREDLFAAPHHPEIRYGPGAPRPHSDEVAAQKHLPRLHGLGLRFARGALSSGKSSPSNTRLELAAPGGKRRIPFVTINPRRRSSSAAR